MCIRKYLKDKSRLAAADSAVDALYAGRVWEAFELLAGFVKTRSA